MPRADAKDRLAGQKPEMKNPRQWKGNNGGWCEAVHNALKSCTAEPR